MTLFDQPIDRPWAVALAVLAGGMTFSASAVVALALGAPDLGDPLSLLAWLVLFAQLTGACLLVAGGVRLARWRGGSVLLAGAAVQVVVCAFYLVYAFAATDAAGLFATTAVVFAALPAASAYLAVRD
jgi:hypothetical protein